MMATAGRCSSFYYSPSTLPLHPSHGLPPQHPPRAIRRGRWLRLKVSAVATDAKFFQPGDTRAIMLFDGVCNLCNGGVRFVREHGPNWSIRYVPRQSESGRKLLQRSVDISSVVLVEKDRSYIKSEAVVRIMEYLDLPFPQLAIFLKFVPLFLRDLAYYNVADNRYAVFGNGGMC